VFASVTRGFAYIFQVSLTYKKLDTYVTPKL